MTGKIKLTRRDFIKRAGVVGAGVALLPRIGLPFSQSVKGISKFTVPLPGLGPNGIPVLSPNKTLYPGTDYYEIQAAQFTQQVHPAIPPTSFWGYADAASKNNRYLGGVIVAARGTPVKIKITNRLPAASILPVDPTLVDAAMAAAFGARTDRIAVHLHGGLVTWDNDGGPFHWFSNADNPGGFVFGPSFINSAGPGAAIYDYPNDQSARFLWYHDHAYGLTRTNAYAGLATAYLITDDAEGQLISTGVLPNLSGYPLGIPLIIQDKTFWDPHGDDPGYASSVPAGAFTGSLWYPHIYEGPPIPSMLLSDKDLCRSGTGRWDNTGIATPPVSTVPEFFSDTMLVNGAPYPTLPVPPRRVRFRFLNGSQARFYNLQLYVADSSPDGITLKPTGETDIYGNPILAPTNHPGPAFIQIGNEAGFLPAPAVFSKNGSNQNSNNVIGYKLSSSLGSGDPTIGNANRYNLLMAPAERPDVIIDFRGFEGRKLVLYNDAPAPFPGGDIRNDYYEGDQDLRCIGGAASTKPGYGPDTRVLMRFEVGTSGVIKELSFAQTVTALQGALPITFQMTQPTTSISPENGTKVKSLNEDFDGYGRLRQTLGNPAPSDYLSVPTEVAQRGEVQRWQIFNFTGDTHPMHFHLVNVTIRKREQWAFTTDVNGEAIPLLDRHGMPYAIPGTARPADANEQGWKETVRMNPGEVITVDMKFTLPSGKPPPPSPRLQASYGIKGAEYVWHCHILEHEEHDMMHALVVI
jgi:FtsP/CotA-like multicopper oxidase with cupredoxin domain